MEEEKRVKVRALVAVYSGEKYHRPGDVLVVPESHFHEEIMERVADDTPERITSSGEALAAERRDTLESRAATHGLIAGVDTPTGAADVLGAQLADKRK